MAVDSTDPSSEDASQLWLTAEQAQRWVSLGCRQPSQIEEEPAKLRYNHGSELKVFGICASHMKSQKGKQSLRIASPVQWFVFLLHRAAPPQDHKRMVVCQQVSVYSKTYIHLHLEVQSKSSLRVSGWSSPKGNSPFGKG